ncbi:hypothetical protein [Urbifossiella limnaea]|uniref:Uncharacterized protein n=1 Tax=Urbifossiella limnaea TaxID=2528023 RepID=A0A517XU54_9BACT|nr:hypothetical protein [Urbifossiella limnaea]QDU20984.1 hypothetical protein ETAA1_29470 [Urbifossiella limnaea]
MPATTIKHPGATPAFLARVYQFERDRLTRIIPAAGNGYVLPAVWSPDHSVWRKLRSAAGARGLDPARYVRWCLDAPQVGYPPKVPEPNRLLEARRLDLYEGTLPTVRLEIAGQFRREKETARRNLTVRQQAHGQKPEFAQINVVADGGHLDLSPLFCYVLARDIGTNKLLRIARRLEGDALFQFGRDAEENAAVYGVDGHLPDGFTTRAAEFYASLIDAFAARHDRGVRT